MSLTGPWLGLPQFPHTLPPLSLCRGTSYLSSKIGALIGLLSKKHVTTREPEP